MPIIFRCRFCGQKLSVSNKSAGTSTECPRCAQEISIPVPPSGKAQPGKPQPTAKPTPKPTSATKPTPKKPVKKAKPDPVVPSDDDYEFELRGSRIEADDMDLTPMVDVTFLLLIFFMITASFSMTKTIETPAPDPEKQGAQQTIQNLEDLERTSVMVRIDQEDVIFVDDEAIADPSELEFLLADKLRTEDKNELIIQTDPASRHETFVKVFDAGTGAGMQKIRLATIASDD